MGRDAEQHIGTNAGHRQVALRLSFASLIANRVIKVLYGLLTIFVTIGAVLIFVALVRQWGSGTALALIVVPLYFFMFLIFWRIFMECLIVCFRMGDDIRAIREQGGRIGNAPQRPADLVLRSITAPTSTAIAPISMK